MIKIIDNRVIVNNPNVFKQKRFINDFRKELRKNIKLLVIFDFYCTTEDCEAYFDDFRKLRNRLLFEIDRNI